jgi:hypothetical protein
MNNIKGRKPATQRDQDGKVCTKCNAYREYEFYSIRTGAKDGHKSHCKCCINKNEEQKKKERETKRLAIKNRIEKTCSACKNLISISMFYKDNSRLDGHYGSCIDCERSFRKEQREKHHDKRIYTKRLYYKNRTIATKCFNRIKMNAFYEEARRLTIEMNEQYVVDHIIPIFSNSKMLVCGLHNEFNLQVISTGENLQKGNKFSADDGFYPEFLDS